MKKLYLSAIILLLGIMQVYAQNIPIQVNNVSYELVFNQYPEICVGINDTIDITINYSEWTESGDVKSQNWVLYGDLRFVSSNGASQFPTTRVVSPTNGYGKGRIAYCYSTGGCSSAVAVDIYKLFAPPQGLEIKGPECVVAGQEVVYSIDPILTRNLNDQIGIDTYKWNVLRTPRPPFVDSVLYVSGDRSSVTFTIKEVDPENPPYVSVILGQYNNDSITLSLGNSTPKPEAVDTMYVPVGREPFKVGVIHPDTSLLYTWTCPADDPFSVTPIGKGDSAIVNIKSNGAAGSGTIYVSATFKNIQCNNSYDTIKIERTWGHDYGISVDSTNMVGECYIMGRNYNITLSGDDIPIKTTCDWTLPTGWNFIEGTSDEGKISTDITITPVSPARLNDILIVRPHDQNDHAEPDTIPVHVKPQKIPRERIVFDPCLDTLHQNRVYVDTLGMNLPEGLSFIWNIDNAILERANGQDTMWFTSGESTDTIIMRPTVVDGCDADTTLVHVHRPPVAPISVTSEDTCLFSSSANISVELHVSNPVEGQVYHWSQLPGWQIVCDNSHTTDSSVVTYTTSHAFQDNYPVSVYATGNAECPATSSVPYSIKVDTTDWRIGVDDRLSAFNYYMFYLEKAGQIQSNQNADWLITGYNLANGNTYEVDHSETNQPTIMWWGTPISVTAEIDVPGKCSVYVSWPLTTTRNIKTRKMNYERESTSPHILSLTPNPSNQLVSVKMADEHTYLLYIINSTGRLVYNNTISNEQSMIDTSNIPNGTYQVIVSDGRQSDSKTLMILH